MSIFLGERHMDYDKLCFYLPDFSIILAMGLRT